MWEATFLKFNDVNYFAQKKSFYIYHEGWLLTSDEIRDKQDRDDRPIFDVEEDCLQFRTQVDCRS